MAGHTQTDMDLEALRNASAAMRAAVDELHVEIGALQEATETIWTLFAVVVTLFMQCGFAMLEAGVVRERAVRDVLMKNLLDATLGAVAWFLLGSVWAADGGSGFIGLPLMHNATIVTPFDAILAAHTPDRGRYLMGYVYAVTSSTIVSGAIAERTQQRAYLVSTIAMVGLIYPVVVHWIWSESGWLSRRSAGAVLGGGAYDWAGGGVVHLTGAALALIAAKIAGPRKGRFDPETGNPVELRGHSSVLLVLGTLLLFIGWIGFNVGSTPRITTLGAADEAAAVALRTTLAGSAGCLVAVLVANCRHRSTSSQARSPMPGAGRWSLEAGCNGLLAGMVSITACAPVVGDWAALLIGGIGGLLYALTSYIVVWRLQIDDVVDAFAVHGACGMWSLLVVGLIGDVPGGAGGSTSARGLFLSGGGGQLLGAQLLAIASIFAWTMVLGWLLFSSLQRHGWMRIPTDFELIGIDISELGRSAYIGPAMERLNADGSIEPAQSIARTITPAPSDDRPPASSAPQQQRVMAQQPQQASNEVVEGARVSPPAPDEGVELLDAVTVAVGRAQTPAERAVRGAFSFQTLLPPQQGAMQGAASAGGGSS
jgi:Amt family ammonium transporter